MTEWRKTNFADVPKEIEIIGRGLYLQCRNIEQIEHEEQDGMPSYIDWECDSREITFEEYNLISEIASISNEKAIDAYTEQLIEEGIL